MECSPPADNVTEDSRLLHAARSQARIGFDKARELESGSADAQKLVNHAEEVAKLLRHNIVQGETQDGEEVISRLHISASASLSNIAFRATNTRRH